MKGHLLRKLKLMVSERRSAHNQGFLSEMKEVKTSKKNAEVEIASESGVYIIRVMCLFFGHRKAAQHFKVYWCVKNIIIN